MVIPKEVEDKIRFICSQVWNVEWSGTLFFKYEGSFDTNDLVIKCVDLFVMDIGTQAYTEFDMNPDVINYMCENPDLLDCQMGLIHSHNNMAAFFSGTDISTLKEEGKDRNNFVSLIVNNAGTYVAAITRKVTTKKVKSVSTYSFFGEDAKEFIEETETASELLEYFDLSIEKEGVSNHFEDIQARLNEIRKKKEEQRKAIIQTKGTYNTFSKPLSTPYSSVPGVPSISSTNPTSKGYTPFSSVKSKDEDLENWDNGTITSEPIIPYEQWEKESMPMDNIYGVCHISTNNLNYLITQLIVGCVIVAPKSKEEQNKWVSNMTALYKKRFGEGPEGMADFKAWADMFTEYLTWYIDEPELEKEGFDQSEISAICAYDLIEALEKLPQNAYIKGYINSLGNYLI